MKKRNLLMMLVCIFTGCLFEYGDETDKGQRVRRPLALAICYDISQSARQIPELTPFLVDTMLSLVRHRSGEFAFTCIESSFYRVFAQDRWGRQFFDTSDLDGPLPEITAESKVRTHGVTDVDRDGRLEIWVTYRLVWGEVGAMGWEETGTGWTRFAIHCFDCD